MTKSEFISKLRNGLAGFPEKELERYIEYYSEIIEDKIEEGTNEKQAVASVGKPDEVINKILVETPLAKLAKNKIRPKRKLSTGERVLIIAGSPLWISLLAALFAVIISVLASLLAIFISLWATDLALAVSGIAGVIMTVFFFIQGNAASAFFILGCGLFAAGISVFTFFGLKALTVYTIKSCKKLMLKIKRGFVNKEATK